MFFAQDRASARSLRRTSGFENEEDMWRRCCVIAVTFVAAVIAVSPAAAESPARDAFWKRAEARCNATSNVKNFQNIEPYADRIAATAEDEHRRWSGHEVDHTGRLY